MAMAEPNKTKQTTKKQKKGESNCLILSIVLIRKSKKENGICKDRQKTAKQTKTKTNKRHLSKLLSGFVDKAWPDVKKSAKIRKYGYDFLIMSVIFFSVIIF
jgi:hypothetical protein